MGSVLLWYNASMEDSLLYLDNLLVSANLPLLGVNPEMNQHPI